MNEKQWTKRWKNWVRPTELQGVWERKEGGYLVRARALDPTTGKMKEIKKVLPEADKQSAYKWLHDELERVRSGRAGPTPPQRTLFAEFAASLFERKVQAGDIKAERGCDKWRNCLEHFVSGTAGKKTGKKVEGFGAMFIDKIDTTHVERWKASMGELIAAGDYAPTTCNGWLSILRVIDKAAKREFKLAQLFTEGVKDFDESEHETYTEEEPNSLLLEEVPAFLAALKELYPQHYAMTYLGLATGLRPSSLRPLRRKGATPDILWDEATLLVRRSHSKGTQVRNTTKQKVKYKIHLPEELMDVLRWHVETQLETPEQIDSDLLFPSVKGGFRALSVLNKPFTDVAEEIELGKQFTQCGLRRTFNDLMRAADVRSIVTRSISGHLTERMQEHYSTVNAAEQRQSIAKVIDLMKVRQERQAASTPADASENTASGAPGGAPTSPSGAPNEKAG